MGNDNAADDVYDTKLQVVGLFLIIAVSFLGMCVAFGFRRLGSAGGCRIASMVFLKGLGIGVIVCTACIHLINEAFEDFEDAGWSEDYESWPFVFALIGVLLSAMFEFYSERTTLGNKGSVTLADLEDLEKVGHHDSDDTSSAHSSSKITHKTAMIVEAGILCHSILIGFDLGLNTKTQWRTLVVAVCFHQFFEGLALAQVILEAELPTRKIVYMTLFYSFTTAIGVAIGIATHTAAGTEGTSLKLFIGILNSFCGGVILYIGMISLFVPWFLRNKQLQLASKRVSLLGFFGIALGFAAMAIIGIWA
mmetsp:Transcript_16016/g.34667  ORF Transcript_16016/g.34667 Transcript_16016/m.34667 type:complete len:307 (-) Transcript_16016:1505-2425(-)